MFVIINKDGIKINELINKGICNKRFIWDPSNCECQCDKSYDIGEYLDYESCKSRKKIVDKLIEQCSNNIDGDFALEIP